MNNLIEAILIVPRLRVQNANCISSPLTWGFPSISAFTGLMVALSRKLDDGLLYGSGMTFHGVGVVCHDFEAQVDKGEYENTLRLMRHSNDSNGEPYGIIEQGRIHLEITLVFDVRLSSDCDNSQEKLNALAKRVHGVIRQMRVAGGDVISNLRALEEGEEPATTLELISTNKESQFRRLARSWLPGFVLVSRHDLLQSKFKEMHDWDQSTTLMDAWLDLSRWNSYATSDFDSDGKVIWETERRDGWIVPIPVGFTALSELYGPDLNDEAFRQIVFNSRDPDIAFQFVESIWSIGQWISPHRLSSIKDVLWFPEYDDESLDDSTLGGLYKCRNNFTPKND
jgi:CRISPR-associated protein Csy2